MRLLRHITLFLFVLLAATQSIAQRFPFFNLKVENGLVQSQATCLTQDHYGNLWIGTLGGISRYDGKKIMNYTVSDGLNANTIIDILFTSKGELLVSTEKGLLVFDGHTFRTLTDEKKQAATGISQMCTGSRGRVYCLRQGRLSFYDTASPYLHNTPVREELSTIYYKDGVLSAAGINGIIYMIDEQQFSKTDSTILTDSSLFILKLFEDSRNNYWVLCNKGLYRKSGRSIYPYMLRGKPVLPVPLFSAAEDQNGQLWLAAAAGAFRMKDTTLIHFHQKNGLTNNIVYEAMCDNEGNIWLSSDGEGVFRYSGGPFISLDESFGLPNKQVTGITGDHKGTIYFSGYRGKISSFTLPGPVRNIEAPELSNDIINNIAWQDQKGLWIGTRNNGLFLMQQGRTRPYNIPGYKDKVKHVTVLYKDSREQLFVGTPEGILCISGSQNQYSSLDGAKPYCFAEIGEDSTLIASETGFWLYHRQQAIPWKTGKLPDSIMTQCMVYHHGILYIGTTERGIIAYRTGQHTYSVLNTKHGLSSDFVYNMIKDTAGNIWAGTGMGICRITETGANTFSIKIFGKANGIIGLESNSNAAFADADGHLWFGTTEGVSCYFPSARPTQTMPRRIILESVKLFGGRSIDREFFARNTGWYNVPEGLKLPYRYNNLSFSFQAITLSPVDKILYRYILEGSGINWSEWSEENTINFSALEPGQYTLKVMCKIDGMIQEQATLSYSFSIKTPFHKSIWFVVSIFGLAILLGVYLQYTANKRKVNRQKREDALRREEQSRVRERTAEDFHDEVGNKLTRINVLTNVLKSKINHPNPDAERLIQQIQDNSQQLYAGTRDILWSLQPSNDNLFEILNHVRDLAAELFSETNISFVLSGNEESLKEYRMPLDKSRNFIMIWKEALNNCMKYAAATKVLLQVQYTPAGQVQVRLVDDGNGFDAQVAHQGNGLKNMKSRAGRLDASLEVLSSDKGTQVILTLPDSK